MKILEATIKNFRVIKDLHIDFRGSDGNPRPVTVLIGDNGSGKTTVLQALALTLSMATGKTENPSKLLWNGFRSERLDTFGPTDIELKIKLDDDEIKAAKEISALARTVILGSPRGLLGHSKISDDIEKLLEENKNEESTIRFHEGRVGGSGIFSENYPISLLSGRQYELMARKNAQNTRDYLFWIGDVFWFAQDRSIGIKNEKNGDDSSLSWTEGVHNLRESLIGLWAYHISDEKDKDGDDLIIDLEKAFKRVFPGIKFKGIKPMPSSTSAHYSNDFYFLLESNGKVFDISEMSSGEQAVFAILYEFVRQKIAKSIVLIDELELHLHPPEQQAVYAALPRIGPDCQFIITTHSRHIEGLSPVEEQVRLEGGRLCL